MIFPGDDWIWGQGGKDYLYGQLGNDSVYGGNQADYVWAVRHAKITTLPKHRLPSSDRTSHLYVDWNLVVIHGMNRKEDLITSIRKRGRTRSLSTEDAAHT